MQLAVNVKNTIQNFGAVFSGSTKVLLELIQNSRRSGATVVDVLIHDAATKERVSSEMTHYYLAQNNHRLAGTPSLIDVTVSDNGCGISDFNSLLTLSESDWSDDVQGEHPFGMGFFSALYAATSVTITSGDMELSFQCADALSMVDIGEPKRVPPVVGTVIKLFGVNVDAYDAIVSLRDLAWYSRIVLNVNGVSAHRHGSLDAQKALNTPILSTPWGDISMIDPFGDVRRVVLQDQVVYQSYEVHKFQLGHNTLFTDTLKARMPDRDVLVNQNKVLADINAFLRVHQQQLLITLRHNMADDVAFLEKHGSSVVALYPELLLDCDYLPSSFFAPVNLQVLRDDTESNADAIPARGVHRHENVLSLGFHSYLDDCSVLAFNAVYFAKGVSLCEPLPDNHWFHDKCINTHNDEFEVHACGVKEVPFSLSYAEGGIALICETLSMVHKSTGLEIPITNNAFGRARYYNRDWVKPKVIVDGHVKENDFWLLIPSTLAPDASLEDALLQMHYYSNDNDPLDTELSIDLNSLEEQLEVARGGDVLNVLSRWANSMPILMQEALEGKPIKLVRKDGKAFFVHC